MPARIEDVALQAGVSTATVSRALRGLSHVAEPTRLKVVEAAKSLDYVVSPSASSLASGRTQMVGVVVPYVSRWFFGQVIAGVEGALRTAGFDMLLYSVGTDESRRRFFNEMPIRRRVDALLVLTLPLAYHEVEALRFLRMPTALVGAAVRGFSSVGIDDVAGATTATRHLINLGHERIAMISGGTADHEHFTAPQDRSRGYRFALASAGLLIDPDLDVDGEYTREGGERAMSALLSLQSPPTAVFAQSDEMAYGALRALRRAGLRCPEDVSIVGFDDHEMADFLDLTTISQPVHAQGAAAAARIIVALGGETDPVQQLFPTQIVIRGTTAPLGG
jgi:LacI family repressor for deo operon, udp, cdd, tsx, nupC, and nupG